MIDAYELMIMVEENRRQTAFVEDVFYERIDRVPPAVRPMFEQMIEEMKTCNILLTAVIDMDMASNEAWKAANERYLAARAKAGVILEQLKAIE